MELDREMPNIGDELHNEVNDRPPADPAPGNDVVQFRRVRAERLARFQEEWRLNRAGRMVAHGRVGRAMRFVVVPPYREEERNRRRQERRLRREVQEDLDRQVPNIDAELQNGGNELNQ